MEKLVFFIQSPKPYGGAHTLYLDLASYIADNVPRYETYYLNYYYPEVERDYANSKLHICNVETYDFSRFENATFFVSINYLVYLLTKIKDLKKARIIVYFFHPNVFDWYSAQYLVPQSKLTDILKLLNVTNSYAFMDKSNYISIKNIAAEEFFEEYVPVTIHNKPLKRARPKGIVKKNELHIGWLGRLDMDKVASIINLANNLMDVDFNGEIYFHLIGDGLAKKAINVQKYSPKIKFVFTSYLYGKERDEYISNNIDIGVAMGVSALDITMAGVPTIIPLVSPTPYRDDKFLMLYDTTGYSLGFSPNDIKTVDCNVKTIQEIIDFIYDDRNKRAAANRCINYATNMFSIKNGAELLLNIIPKTTLTVQDCLNCPSIKKQLKRWGLYCKLRGDDEYSRYHSLILKMRMLKKKSLKDKIKFFTNKTKSFLSALKAREANKEW